MIKRLTALLLTLTSSLLLAFDGSTPSTAQTPEADGLYPAYIQSKYGFINKPAFRQNREAIVDNRWGD